MIYLLFYFINKNIEIIGNVIQIIQKIYDMLQNIKSQVSKTYS